mgnify:CR=1 FL=1|jgi:hypothetical protein
MRIVWTNRVSDELDNNLSFWLNKNKSNVYPNKILDEIEKLEKQIKENPLFLYCYIESLNLFQRFATIDKKRIEISIEDV